MRGVKNQQRKILNIPQACSKDVICYKNITAGYWYSHLLPDDKSKRAISNKLAEDGASV